MDVSTRQLMTVYCDEPSHTSDLVGLFVRSSDQNPNQAALIHVELGRNEGVYLAAFFYRYENSRHWAPEMRSIRGLAKRGGGLQVLSDGESPRRRYRLKCDRCDLTYAVREPGFSDKLTALAGQGIIAVSLRALIEHAQRT